MAFGSRTVAGIKHGCIKQVYSIFRGWNGP